MIRRNNPTYKLIFITLTFLLIIAGKAFAVGAYPYPQNITQPDGTTLTIKINGDEWFNWISTVDGYRIIKNSDNIYEYATLLKSGKAVPSGILANNETNRTHQENEFLSTLNKGSGFTAAKIKEIRESKTKSLLKSSNKYYFAPTGKQKMLVILATFSDKIPQYTKSQFQAMMSQEGYDGTGSFRDYYLEVSGGLLEIDAHVTDWVTVPNTYEYYGNENRWTEFAYEAVKQAHLSGVDLSIFDNDGDGVIEGIAIIHQGTGQEVSGNENDIWSHSFSFSSAGYTANRRTFNGVKIDQYTVQAEFRDASRAMNTIGVICHEFGHNLGLPDFYDTDGENDGDQSGTGNWDIMASGSYNGTPAGSSPAHHNAFSKIELGWITADEIDDPDSYTLQPVIESEKVFKVNGPDENEYYLLENRQKNGFDASLPGSGMIIYHVDEDVISAKRRTNKINTTEHQGLYVVPGTNAINKASTPFPGTLNKTEFTDFSNPQMQTWSNKPYNRSITGIEHINGNISFNYMSIQNGSPVSLKAKAISANEIEIEWGASIQNYPILIASSEDGVFGNPKNNTNYQSGDQISGGGEVIYFGDDQTTIIEDNLLPTTTYYYRAWSYIDGEWSSFLTSSATTLALPIVDFPWSDSFETGLYNWTQEFTEGSFLWEIATVGTNSKPEQAADGDNFIKLFADSFDENSTLLISPPIVMENDKDYFIQFQHIQYPWEDEQDELKIYTKTKNQEEWELLDFIQTAETEWIQRRYILPNSESTQVAFEGIVRYGYGIGIDNIIIYEDDNCQTNPYYVSNIQTADSTETSISLIWDNPNSEDVLIIARKTNKNVMLPEVGTNYIANSQFGEGDIIGDDAFVVYNDNGNNLSITNLEHTSDYHFSFFAHDNYCYNIEPITYKSETVPVFHNMSLKVVNNELPVANAKITIDDDNFNTDSNGKIYWPAKHDTLYKSLTITHDDYKLKQLRVNFIQDSLVTVELQQHKEIPTVKTVRYMKRNNNITLAWDPIINESFEYYQPFSLFIDGWTQIDGDNGQTYAIKDHRFPNQGYIGSFIVFAPHYADVLQTEYDMSAPTGKQLLAAFASVNAPNDDWLISPEFTVNENDNISLVAKSITDKYGLESFRIVAIQTDEETMEEIHTPLIEESNTPTEWTHYLHSLSQFANEKIKIAIHYNSADRFALLIDDIKVASESENPLPTNRLKSKKLQANIERTINNHKAIDKKYTLKSPEEEEGEPFEEKIFGYKIKMNGNLVGNTISFAKNTFLYSAENVGINTFNIKAVDYFYNIESEWTNDINILGGYKIAFIVKDLDDNIIENATVLYNNQKIITDENGVALFDGVEPIVRKTYTVSCGGYQTEESSIAPSSDRTVVVRLTSISTDSTALSNGEEIIVYPNPLIDSNEIFFSGIIDGDATIIISDIIGNTIINEKLFISKDKGIKINNLSKGLYIIKIIRGNNHKMLKLIVN